jgi:uncharacterized protein (TIGR02145 family)
VSVVPITANYVASPPTVTFQLSWPAGTRDADNRPDVWIFVEYKKVKDNAYSGSWTRAGIAGAANISSLQTASASYVTGNTSGFFVKGPATGDFAATVTVPLTVDLTGHASQFSWCAYAIDRPPHAEATNGHYVLHGTPPFTITTTGNGATVTETTYAYNNTCIYGLTDATGCPGEIPFTPPEITGFTASASSICAGQSVMLTATTTGAAASYSFNNGYSWQASSTTVRTPENSFTYTLLVMPSPGACTVSSSTTHPLTVRPLPTPAFVNPPAGMCPNTTATLTASGAGSGGSYCFTYECTACLNNPYLTGNDEPAASDCAWYAECIYGEANTYTVAMYDAGSLTVWVRAMTEYGCVDSIPITIGAFPVFSAGSITDASATTTQGTAPSSNPANAVEASGGDGDITYEWRRSGTSSATLTGSNSSGYALNSDLSNYDTEGAYTFTRYAKDGTCNTAFTPSGGQYALEVVYVPPPPGAGTNTYTCGTQTWSEPVKIAACDKTSYDNDYVTPYCRSYTYNGIKYFYYNWAYMNANKGTMCPSPWHVPTSSDFTTLINCLGTSETFGKYYPEYSTWGGAKAGRCSGGAVGQQGEIAFYWANDNCNGNLCPYLIIAADTAAMGSFNKNFGYQVRCVR